jgi:hypothetical protein
MQREHDGKKRITPLYTDTCSTQLWHKVVRPEIGKQRTLIIILTFAANVRVNLRLVCAYDGVFQLISIERLAKVL